MVAGTYWYITQVQQVPIVACTLEAKLCSDGSYVGRVGPKCEFAACPNKPVSNNCTQEAKLCPDGSAVGRTGPNCAFAACPGGGSATGTVLGGKSGIRGKIMLGPTCPVEAIPPNPSCNDKPYQTQISVFPVNDPVHALLFTSSRANGTFKVLLPPGEYALGAGEKPLPRCEHPQVTVLANAFSEVVISCDTGIR